MRRRIFPIAFVLVAGFGGAAVAQQPAGAGSAASASASATEAPTETAAPPPAATAADPVSHGEAMQALEGALAARKLGSQTAMTQDDVRARDAEAEDLLRVGRVDEAISRLLEMVESPQFAPFAENDVGRAAVFLLGNAYATAGVNEPARAYLRRVLTAHGAWDNGGIYARRAVRRLVEMGISSEKYDAAVSDLASVPSTAPEETLGEVAYLRGRADEAKGDPDAALTEYAKVTQRSRFWAQATYLQGLIQVEKGHMKEGEDLFCKIADPKREARTTPVFADERFFAVRDLARLALGRVAHEQFRFDDARYYYYLVPKDSDRLAEALYEAATGRYEKKDYEGARELLDELKGLQIHHPYEDEAWILDAYIDLAQCKFKDADEKLLKFVALYEPVRDAARRLQSDDHAMQAVVTAARAGSDAGNADVEGGSPEAMRTIAALLRVDPAYGAIARRRAVLEHEASGLRLTEGSLADLQRQLSVGGGVRPAIEDKPDAAARLAEAQNALDGVRRLIGDLRSGGAPAARIAPLEKDLDALDVRVREAKDAAGAGAQGPGEAAGGGKDLPDLLRSDSTAAVAFGQPIAAAERELDKAEITLAKDALRRLDLRLSRLLRRAHMGRIESVLGRKRALEVEIEAINNGYLPQDALDSLDAARYLQDNEEYWPFEGDDWPDEFVGGEGLK